LHEVSMRPVRTPQALLSEFKKLLATQVKLDIASAIREHPHLEGDAATAAYNTLTRSETVDDLVRDLAYEEAQDAVTRGEIPPAALLLLAGFQANPVGQC